MGVKPRTEEEGRRTVEEAWKGVAAAMEHEACGVLDEVDANGQPRVKHTGRQAIPLIVQAPHLSPRKSARHGAYLQQHAAAWVATRLEQLKASAEAWQKGAVNDRTKEQWGRMQKAFSKPSSLMHKLLNGQDKQEEGGWKRILEDVEGLSIDRDHNRLGGHVEWVKAHLERTKRRDVEEAGKAWRRWV